MTSTFKAPSSTLWTSLDAARATGGQTTRNWYASGVSIDTRTLRAGDLFIAIRGEKVDGHDFVAEALAHGAVAAVVDYIPENVDPERLLMVPDTLTALEDLGRAARGRCSARVIAITGSVGKSGTREMMSEAFSVLGQTYYSEKNFNDHWGVPLTLCRMHSGTDFSVVEIGMMAEDELIPLSLQARPHVAVITNCAPAEIPAVGEIFAGMDANGIAILNRDIDQFEILKLEATGQGVAKIFTFGTHEQADARLLDTLIASNGIRIRAMILGEEISFTLRHAALHTALNALAVLLSVRLIDGDIESAARALERMDPLGGKGRHEIIMLGDPKNPVTLIDESYNSSPFAMQAAFKVMALIDPGRGGRRIAILGDMLELGERGSKVHADLMLPLKAANVDLVYTCGPLMKNLYDKLAPEQQGAHRANSIEMASIVPDVLVPGDVVMVKGSAGSKMNVVVEALRTLPSKRHAANFNR